MTIIKIELGEEKAKEISKKVQELIISLNGKVEKSSFWGKRKLAYEVKHHTEGFYDVVDFEIAADKVSTLNAKLSLMPEVLRYLVTAVNAEK